MMLTTLTTIIPILIGLVGIILSFYFYKKTRHFKDIEISSISDASVIEIKEPIQELKIFYKEKEINELWVLTFKIKNAGKIDITSKDFVVPFHGSFGAPIVGAKIIERHPQNCDLEIERYESDKIYFKTELFKAGEIARIKINLLNKPKINFDNNRIIDLNRIRIEDKVSKKKIYNFVFGTVTGILIGFFTFFIFDFLLTPDQLLKVSVSHPVITEIVEKPGIPKYMIAISIVNEGKSKITPNDFVEPIIINTKGLILEANNSMKDIILDFAILDQQTIRIDPFQIEPSQVAGIYILVEGSTDISIYGRAKGLVIIQ